ncbi:MULTISPECIES: hypothetical protein [Bacillus]|uniref:Uncharacterized protein n=1 Tax=Bacillus aerius TaxID=293388 RepID=A0ABR6B1L7_9BACI|nr:MULTISPECIES: hypothetical protein [Bacillus]MBX7002470.1 hypothetical protein [Bacillus aerophilus]CVM66378.1 Uncharacterised protein [Streptococcus pneumoniae]ALM29771.1 hypothetical protein AKO65_17690 [Bacillus altitudinis]ALM46307.1 hypothetical protein AMR71_14005 [Bacillus altitudinis]ANY97788.1 hypothetical protein AKO66_14010 [Bacillus altitudinis]
MSSEVTMLRELLDEITDNNAAITDQYETAKQEYDTKRAKVDILDRIAYRREGMGNKDTEAFKEHFQITTLKKQVEQERLKFEAVENEYMKASRFNTEVIDTLSHLINQKEHS